MNVTVLGAGTMGNGIAHVFALGGHTVTLVDVSEAALGRGRATIEKNLARQVAKGLAEADRDAALARLSTGTDVPEAVSDADLVVEAASERFDVKADLFRHLDVHAPERAILATNTSSISITSIAAVTKRPGLVIGMHFFNPVPVMTLVEVVRGLATSDATYEAVRALSEALGKVPVEVNDAPGFVSNRVLMPMINEAIFCLHEGVATKESVDEVMKRGMAHPMGPIALADFIGLDVCLAILEVLHRELGDDKYRPCPLLRKMVAAGRLGKKTGQGFYDYGG